MKQIKASKQTIAEIKWGLKLAEKTPEKYKQLYWKLWISITFVTYSY